MDTRGMLTLLGLVAALALTACGAENAPQTLEELLGWGGANEEARLQAKLRQAESLIADCMAREGFTYIPVDFAEPDSVVAPVEEELSREEFVRRHGFGMTRWIDEPQPTMPPPTEWHDPNAEYVGGLGEAEREAYHVALYGHVPFVVDGPDGGPADDFLDDLPAEGGGCSAEARDAVYGDSEQVWQELSDEFDALHQRIESDPRIAESMTAWASCMRVAGYDFADKHEPFAYLEAKLHEEVYIQIPDESLVHPDTDGTGASPQVDRAALALFRAEEIAIATADLACDLEADLDGVRARVTADHESRFIAAHREQLEVLRGDS